MAADISLLPGEYAAQEGDERALFALLEGRIEAVKIVDGIDTRRRRAASRRHLRRGADRARHRVPGRVPRGRAVARDARRAARLPRASRPRRRTWRGGRQAGGRPDGRLARPAGHRRRAAAAARDRRRAGARDAACAELRHFLERNQITFKWVTPDAPDAAEQWGGPLPADGDCPAIRVDRRQDGGAAAAAPRRRAARARHRGRPRAEYDTVDRRRRPLRPGGRRVRRLGGAAHDRRRARGARRPGRHLVADRELPRLPLRRLGRRAREPRAAAGAPARRRDPRHARDHAHRRRRRARCTSTAATCCARGRSSSPAASPGGASRSRASTGSPARASPTAPRAARRPTAHGLDVHIVGAGNSAGQAAMFFSTHARSVTILCRGDGLEKSMSRYLIDQLAARPNIERDAPHRGRRRARRRRARGDRRARQRDRRGRRGSESGGLFIFIGADAETALAAAARSRSTGRGYVLTGADVRRRRARGRSSATPTCSRRACPASSPAATCAPARSSASPPPSARAAWRSPSCTST